jgi:hypothetical protein
MKLELKLVTASRVDLSTLTSTQLDQQIAQMVSKFVDSDTKQRDKFSAAHKHGLADLLPLIKEMQAALSQRGTERNPRNLSGQTFSAWLIDTTKSLKGKVSTRTIYRRLAKMADYVKPFALGTPVRDAGLMDGCVVKGSDDQAEEDTSWAFQNEKTGVLETHVCKTAELSEITPRAIQKGDLLLAMDLDGGTEFRYADGQLTRTEKPIHDELAKLKAAKTPKGKGTKGKTKTPKAIPSDLVDKTTTAKQATREKIIASAAPAKVEPITTAEAGGVL